MERKVLIVEDEVLVGMMLARTLEVAGYSVLGVVGTGEEAVAAAKERRPGAMLLDVSLGGDVDGIEVARRIREFETIPVIFFTGYNRDSRLMDRAAEVQALAVLDKLGPVEELLAALEKAFS
jgi:CheY-like chemotaxis protein